MREEIRGPDEERRFPVQRQGLHLTHIQIWVEVCVQPSHKGRVRIHFPMLLLKREKERKGIHETWDSCTKIMRQSARHAGIVTKDWRGRVVCHVFLFGTYGIFTIESCNLKTISLFCVLLQCHPCFPVLSVIRQPRRVERHPHDVAVRFGEIMGPRCVNSPFMAWRMDK